MDDLLNQISFSLEVSWSRLQQMIGSHAFLIVAAVAIFFLLWVFMAPAARNRR